MLTTNQQQPNPTARERRILHALAAGASRRETAEQTGLTIRAVAAILERLRDRFAPTQSALIALAVKLEWITVPIWTMPPPPPPPPTRLTIRGHTRRNPGTPAPPEEDTGVQKDVDTTVSKR